MKEAKTSDQRGTSITLCFLCPPAGRINATISRNTLLLILDIFHLWAILSKGIFHNSTGYLALEGYSIPQDLCDHAKPWLYGLTIFIIYRNHA